MGPQSADNGCGRGGEVYRCFALAHTQKRRGCSWGGPPRIGAKEKGIGGTERPGTSPT
ncbi:UNVERIFIED_ORG: hypothetical protein BDU10_9398 [Burkholderia sp. CF145]|jgi:hypothetical protein